MFVSHKVQLERGLAGALSASICLVLSGCGMATTSSTLASSSTGVVTSAAAPGVSGSVHGGTQAIVGAYIQLYAVGTGFGSGAVPLVPTSTASAPDSSVQSIVTTSSTGSFSLAYQFTCPVSNPYVYITAVGGNPGVAGSSVDNTGTALMAALGPCMSLTSGTKIEINEITTVAAVWALQNFINIPFSNAATSLWSGGGSCTASGAGTSASPYSCSASTAATGFSLASSSTNTTGLAAAFNTAAILANTSTGTSPGSNSSKSAATIESWSVDGIGDILSYCVNSAGVTTIGASLGVNCSNSSKNGLLNYVSPTATAINYSSGTDPVSSNPLAYAVYTETYAPADTLQAAWLMARNPAYNVATLFGLISSTPAYSGEATSFSDFTIGYSIAGTFDGSSTASSTVEGLFPSVPSSATPVPLASPFQVAFDKYGNAFVSNLDIKGSSSGGAAPYNPFITELDANGNYIGLVSGYNIAGTFSIFGGNANSTSIDGGNANEYMPVVFDNSNHFYVYDQFTGYIAGFNGSSGAGKGVANPATTTIGGNAVTSALITNTVNSNQVSTNAVNTGVVSSAGKAFNNMVYDGNGNLWLTTQTAASSGVAPFSSNSASLFSIPTSVLTSASPTYSGTATSLIGGAGWGLVVDNTSPSSTTGAPFVYVGYLGGCSTPSSSSTLNQAGQAYGLIDAFYGSTTGSKTTGSSTAFSPLLDYNGTSSYFTTSTSCPVTGTTTTAFGPVTATYGANAASSVVPIAAPMSMAVDASNNIWLLNETTPEVGTNVSYPAYSLVKFPAPTYAGVTGGGATATFPTPISNSNGGLQGGGASTSAPGLSKEAYYDSWAIAVDGAGSVWVASNYNLSEFNNNDVALSPATYATLGTTQFYGFSGGQTSSSRRNVGTYKNVAVDRSGNVWVPGASSNGTQINVLVGAATAVATPLLPPTQGTLP